MNKPNGKYVVRNVLVKFLLLCTAIYLPLNCNFQSSAEAEATTETLSLKYPYSSYTFSNNTPIPTLAPQTKAMILSCQAKPTLPAGLSINPSNCAISGTPTLNQSLASYEIIAQHITGILKTVISVEINSSAPTVTFTGSPYVFTNTVAITPITPALSGTATSCISAPSLPPGLVIDNTTCEISGTPMADQILTAHTITVTNAFGSTNSVIMITVNMAPPSGLTFAGSPFTFVSGTPISSVVPALGGTITTCSSTPPLPTGLTLNNTSCEISGTPSITQNLTIHTITAQNISGTVSANISISVLPPVAISTVSPPNGTVNYQINTPYQIQVTFNQPMNAGTLTVQNVSGACDLSKNVAFSRDNFVTCMGGTTSYSGNTLSFEPAEKFCVDTDYSLSFRVRTLVENALGVNLAVQFDSVSAISMQPALLKVQVGAGGGTSVNAIAVSCNTLFIGGNFNMFSGPTGRQNLAVVDLISGNLSPLGPINFATNGTVHALAISDNRLFVGGNFTNAGAQPRNNIASFDINTGNVDAWNPGTDGTVYALATQGGSLYAAGQFATFSGSPRSLVGAVDISTGAILAGWNAFALGTMAKSLHISGGLLYIGGNFSSMGGQLRNNIAALSLINGNSTAWNPGANLTVNALIANSTDVYAGGDFSGASSFAGASFGYVGSASVASGLASAFTSMATNNVLAITANSSQVFMGGSFNGAGSFGGTSRNYMAVTDLSGNINSWDANLNGIVKSIIVVGSAVIVGGEFNTVNAGTPRKNIAIFDLAGANLRP